MVEFVKYFPNKEILTKTIFCLIEFFYKLTCFFLQSAQEQEVKNRIVQKQSTILVQVMGQLSKY